ncbi:MAG: transglutaminase-like domain-containing protein [Cellulophaga sp.]
MFKKNIQIVSLFFFTAYLFHANAQTINNKKLSDSPNDTISINNLTFPSSYNVALQQWKTVIQVNDWIKNNFSYDMERAKKLAENGSERGKINIYSPHEFYQIKKGICVDLSRFTVETINKIDASKNAQYLMIEFEPITIDGKVIRKHWISIYEDIQGYYLLGDSKRPGYIAGPFEKVDGFIIEYQKYRERKIVSWKVLLNYKKKKKTFRQK